MGLGAGSATDLDLTPSKPLNFLGLSFHIYKIGKIIPMTLEMYTS